MKNRFMFCGVKIDGAINDYADALSRFKPYPWRELGFTVIDATNSANCILNKLLDAPPNLDPDCWKWLPHQQKMLKIDSTERYINNNVTTKSRKKVFQRNRNILTKSDFDNDP